MMTTHADRLRQAELMKALLADEILDECMGTEGVWADPTRYRGQCWTRDLVLAVLPVVYDQRRRRLTALRHLENLAGRQRLDGRVPIVFLDGPGGHARFLADKLGKTARDRRMSFMLKRYLRGQLWNLTPGTRDSEILFVLGLHEYERNAPDPGLVASRHVNVEMALDHVRSRLMVDGLVQGADWRDTMEKELAYEPLLTNNALLFRALRLYETALDADGPDRHAESEALRQRILATHFADGRVIDYPGNDRFDPLGAAFAVLHDVVGPGYYPRVVEAMRSVDSPCGVTIKCRHNPISAEERAIIERTDGVVTWPFVVGFSVLALLKMGERAFAEEQFAKLVTLDGFREWYDPATGQGCGADRQLWSATLYWRAYQALRSA